MVRGNGRNQFRQYAGQNFMNHVVQNAVQNLGVQNVRNQNGLIVVPGIANQNLNGNGNVVAPRTEGNVIRNNVDLDEIKEVNANCILITSSTQTDKALIYDSDGSAKVHNYDNCYDNEIFNMYNQEEQYTELLELIPEPHQVQQNDSNVISKVSRVEQDGGIVDQHLATVKETCDYFESLYKNLAIKVEKDEFFLIVNQVDARLQNFKIQFLKEATRFVQYFKSLVKEADESLSKHKALELEIELLLRAVVSQDIMSILQNNSVVDTSNLQNVLERVDNTAKTRRPQPWSNKKNDRVPSASKSSCSKNKEVEVEEHPKNLLLTKNKKHMSSKCNNVKLAIQIDKSEVVCAMSKQCLITANHDVCALNYVNDINSHGQEAQMKGDDQFGRIIIELD
nr:hypothetical protein [Tanacetum cinerariifolium]